MTKLELIYLPADIVNIDDTASISNHGCFPQGVVGTEIEIIIISVDIVDLILIPNHDHVCNDCLKIRLLLGFFKPCRYRFSIVFVMVV